MRVGGNCFIRHVLIEVAGCSIADVTVTYDHGIVAGDQLRRSKKRRPVREAVAKGREQKLNFGGGSPHLLTEGVLDKVVAITVIPCITWPSDTHAMETAFILLRDYRGRCR